MQPPHVEPRTRKRSAPSTARRRDARYQRWVRGDATRRPAAAANTASAFCYLLSFSLEGRPEKQLGNKYVARTLVQRCSGATSFTHTQRGIHAGLPRRHGRGLKRWCEQKKRKLKRTAFGQPLVERRKQNTARRSG